MKFIELHFHGEPALFNLNHIIAFRDHNFLDNIGHNYFIDESYEEIKQLITETKNNDGESEKIFGKTRS